MTRCKYSHKWLLLINKRFGGLLRTFLSSHSKDRGRPQLCFMKRSDLHRVVSNHIGRGTGGSGSHLNQLNLSPLLEEIERADSRNASGEWPILYFVFCILAYYRDRIK